MSEYCDAVLCVDRHGAKGFHLSARDDVKVELMHTAAQFLRDRV